LSVEFYEIMSGTQGMYPLGVEFLVVDGDGVGVVLQADLVGLQLCE
jgi:hypothetical protein